LTFSRESVAAAEPKATRVEEKPPTRAAVAEAAEPLADEFRSEPWEPEPVAAPVAREEEEDRPRRGRGRGRRSDRRATEARDAQEEVPPSETPREEAGSEEPSEGKRRRGRGRGRSKKNDGTRERADSGAPSDTPRAKKEPALAEEDEENVDMSNWVVPSWNDLIASLYRPER
jgi:hypothetical protein